MKKLNKYHFCEKDYLWNPSTWAGEFCKYAKGIIGDSVAMYDETIEQT